MAKTEQKRSTRTARRQKTTKQPDDPPLFDELMAIGRFEKTIRYQALHGYVHLLGCPDVRQRGGDTTDESILAQHASEALRDAIADIVSPQQRLIAEAALATRPPFEGLNIDERVHELTGLSQHQFTYGRRQAFRKIVKRLEHTAPTSAAATPPAMPTANAPILRADAPPPPQSQPNTHRQRNLDLLGHTPAVALHYAAVATLFTLRFTADKKPAVTRAVKNSTGKVINVYSDTPPSLAGYLFQTYYDFLYSTSPAAIAAMDARHIEARRQPLLRLYDALTSCDPLVAHNVSRRGSRWDWEFSENQHGYRHQLSPRQAFSQYWYPWFERPFGSDHADLITTVTTIAGASGAFAAIVAEAVGPNHVPYGTSLNAAKEHLLKFYGHDAVELSPTIDDHLAQYLDAYLPREGTNLTTKAIREIIDNKES